MGSSPVRALEQALSGVELLAIDSAPIVYFIEENPKYLVLVDEVFQRIDTGVMAGVTSVITLTEVLTHPMRHGNQELRESYTRLLLEAAGFSTVPIDAEMASTAAELRARHDLRARDALQLACAIETGSHAFLTNDIRLRQLTEMPVIVLESLLQNG